MRKRMIWFIGFALIIALILLVVINSLNKYTDEIRITAETVNSEYNDLVLAIYTDIHHDPEKKEVKPLYDTMSCLRELTKKVHVDALWDLGDLINGHTTTKDEAIKQIQTVIDAQKTVTLDYHNIAGNHDNNIQATYESNAGYGMEEVLSDDELNDILRNAETKQTEIHGRTRPLDYYVEFPTVRVVCISCDNTTWMPETAAWLKAEALDTQKEVLILAHCPVRPEWGFRNDIENGELIENALKEFIDAGGTIIAYIHGHDHGDMIENAGIWTGVSIGCARFQKPTSNGTEGMVYWDRNEKDATEILFDVVCINQEKRIIRFIRFGAGADREIGY